MFQTFELFSNFLLILELKLMFFFNYIYRFFNNLSEK